MTITDKYGHPIAVGTPVKDDGIVTRISEPDEGYTPRVTCLFPDGEDAWPTSYVDGETWRCWDVEADHSRLAAGF